MSTLNFSMSLTQIKNEVYYYSGQYCSDEDAEEILGFLEDCPGASLDEIISEYFNC